MRKQNLYTVSQAASRVGVHADTLRRWMRAGKIPEPRRNRNNWRVFTEREVQAIQAFADQLSPSGPSGV